MSPASSLVPRPAPAPCGHPVGTVRILGGLAVALGLGGAASAQTAPTVIPVRPALAVPLPTPAPAAAATPSTPPGTGALPQCVGEQTLAPPGPRVWLDEADRDTVLAALRARFPQVARDGLDARALLLWREAGDDWRYAALIDDARAPGRQCVAASFSAATVPPTPGLLRKYFFADGAHS